MTPRPEGHQVERCGRPPRPGPQAGPPEGDTAWPRHANCSPTGLGLAEQVLQSCGYLLRSNR